MLFIGLFIVLLGVLFIGLKLSGKIQWSWVWVLCPLWILPVIAIIGAIFVLILGAIG